MFIRYYTNKSRWIESPLYESYIIVDSLEEYKNIHVYFIYCYDMYYSNGKCFLQSLTKYKIQSFIIM